MIKDRKQLIKEFIAFFKIKAHKEIPNASLIPENDPTVLFTTAGMQPLVPFLLGQKHALGKRLCNVQKCIRTQDINEVGDEFHHTFFEMLGKWSLGDYWKKEAIEYSFRFLTQVLKIPVEKLAVTCFAGDKRVPQIPKDEEAASVWLSLGISKERIAFLEGGVLESDNNWWGPAGKTGPCGPCTEMFYWKSKTKPPKTFNPEDKNWVEIGNDVLMQYVKDKRLILVDGMYCLYDEDFNLNKELLKLINSFNTHTLLTVNGFREKGLELVKSNSQGYDSNWKAFSLEEEGIKKTDSEYFEILMKRFNLTPKEIIYFDHDKKNVETAKKTGILSKHYDDIKSIKKFIEENLFAYFPAKQKNIDFGGGVERIIAVLSGLEDNYVSSCFSPIIKKIEDISGKKYVIEKYKKPMRIIADHLKASVFIIADGVVPSNTEQGYVLRRLIRRAVKCGKEIEIKKFTEHVAVPIFEIYDDYEILKKSKNKIIEELKKEEEKFLETLEQGITAFEKLTKGKKQLSGKDAFLLYQSYGFPFELTCELAEEKNIKINEKEYEKEYEKHQALSRTATQGKFKSGLADNSEATKKLHTATHLLNAALRKVLKNPNIYQKGSNITSERLRFDFNFDRKLTDKEIKEVEELVNEKIKEKIPVICKYMSPKQAKQKGAQGVFDEKYSENVSVYSAGDFSKEICAGPHVNNTSELGTFKIIKEESSAAGVRRIKAALE